MKQWRRVDHCFCSVVRNTSHGGRRMAWWLRCCLGSQYPLYKCLSLNLTPAPTFRFLWVSSLRDSRGQLKYLGHWHPHGRPGLSSQFLASTPWLLQAFREWIGRWVLSLPLSVSLSFFDSQINKWKIERKKKHKTYSKWKSVFLEQLLFLLYYLYYARTGLDITSLGLNPNGT